MDPADAQDINRVTLRGLVDTGTHEPALTGGGAKVVRMTVKTVHRWWSKGEQREAFENHRVVIWDPACVEVARDIRKGDRVELEGEVHTRRYEGGNPICWRYMTEIVLQPGRSNIRRIRAERPGETDGTTDPQPA